MKILKEPLYTHILIGAGILCFVIIASSTILHSCRGYEEKAEVVKMAHDEAVRYHTGLARQDSVISAREYKRLDDSVRSAKKVDSLKSKITGLERVVRKYRTGELRDQVAQLNPDSAEAAVFVRYDSAMEYRDSVDIAKTSLISELEADKTTAWNNFNGLLDEEREKYRIERQHSTNLETLMVRSEKKLDKEVKRRKREEVIGIVLILIAAVL